MASAQQIYKSLKETKVLHRFRIWLREKTCGLPARYGIWLQNQGTSGLSCTLFYHVFFYN